jgi:hypothetical protein
MQTNWMDRQRHALQAYEYLCHVGEALQWIEGSLDEEMQFGVVDMEQGEALQDGVVLAKIARRFLGDGAVKSIWTVRLAYAGARGNGARAAEWMVIGRCHCSAGVLERASVAVFRLKCWTL